MSMDVGAANNQTLAMQGAFQTLFMLQLWSSFWPKPAQVTEGSTYDYIVVGGGAAGCKIAHGLVQNKDINVLLIEAGDIPNIDSLFAGLVSYPPNSPEDWKYTSENDQYTSHSLKNGAVQFAQGKVLGGSSSIDHLAYIRGHPTDYDYWATAANDTSWNFDGLYKYFIENEKLEDPEILNSTYKDIHGINGFIKLKREPQDKIITPYLKSFEEIGYKTVLDINGINNTLGFTQPLFTNDFFRQSNALAFLSHVKDYSNLYLLLKTLVTKIIFEDKVAVGVEVITKDNKTMSLKATREVILTAGNLNTPKLLMLSGIGPAEHLKPLDIDVIADLPVGNNLQDHLSTSVIYAMEESQDPQPPFDPTKFPAPAYIGHVALQENQNYPDYQAIGLVIPHGSPALIPFCSNGLGFSDAVCQAISDANKKRNILWSLIQQLHPKSRGTVRLRSKNPFDAPIVYTCACSDDDDLERQVSYLEDYLRVGDTSHFKEVGAELVDLNLPQCSQFEYLGKEYLKCYILNMAATVYHLVGTCSLGSVVDARLKVFGVSNLTIADSSVIPKQISGNVKAAVNAVAGKAVDILRNDSV